MLLDLLVGRGTSRELEHRKLLAQVYWRMDELAQGYDVLVKALKLQPSDLDSLILMSAVCLILKKFDEAFSYGLQATTVAPNDVRAHAALVSVAFSCPQGFKPDQKFLDAHFRSLQFLQQHESGILRAIPAEPDFHSFFEMVKNRALEVRKLENYYRSHKLPMGFFANLAGHSIFHTWAAFLNKSKLQVRIAFGDSHEQQSEVSAVRGTDSIAIDLFALLTLQHLKLLNLLPKMFRRIYVHPSLLDAVVLDLREIEKHPVRGSIAYVDGKFVHNERTPEQTQVIQSFLAEIRDFLKSPAVTLIGLLPETLSSGHAKLYVQNGGLVSVAPLLVAKEQAVTFFSDDAILRAVGRFENRVPSFCTQAFLRVAKEKKFITQAEYQDAIIKLLESNYTFISEDAGTLCRVYDNANGCITSLGSTLISRVSNPQYDARSCLILLAEFAVYVWCKKEPQGANSREEWIAKIWEAIAKTKNVEFLIEFVGNLSSFCSTKPAVFSGLMLYSISSVPALRGYRKLLFDAMQQAILTVSRLAPEICSLWTSLSADWRWQGRVNRLLERQLFLKF